MRLRAQSRGTNDDGTVDGSDTVADDPGWLKAWLNPATILLICFGCAVATSLFWNVQRSILGETTTASWLDLLDSTAGLLTAVATALVLWSTFAMLSETRTSSILSREITLRHHSDSLTPFLAVESVTTDAWIEGSTNQTLRVTTSDLTDSEEIRVGNGALVNPTSLVSVVEITIRALNASSVGGEVVAELTDGDEAARSLLVVTPGSEVNFSVRVRRPLSSFDDVRERAVDGVLFHLAIDVVGPGGSALDRMVYTARAPVGSAAPVDHDRTGFVRKRHYELEMK